MTAKSFSFILFFFALQVSFIFAQKSNKELYNSLFKGNVSKQFTGAHQITVKVKSAESTGNKWETIKYFIDATGNNMLLNKSSFSKQSTLMQSSQLEEAGSFDGWLFDHSGTSLLFSTSDEMGKIAIKQSMKSFLPVKNRAASKPVIKLVNKQKTIAGYECIAYQVSINTKSEKASLLCWVTKDTVAVKHANMPFFSIFSAGSIGIPGNPKRLVLAFEGISEGTPVQLIVESITPHVEKMGWNNYKIMNMPGI